MADRKVELEKKRKKLEELKKARKQVVGRDVSSVESCLRANVEPFPESEW